MKKIILILTITLFIFLGCTSSIDESSISSYSMKIGEVVNVSSGDSVIPIGRAVVDVSYIKNTNIKTVTLVSGRANFIFGN
jgi:hypothetical protein